MASGLNDKVVSYSIEKGMEFDQAYTTNPTQTGSAASLTWSLVGNAPVRTWDAPHNGGDTCWSFDWTTSSTTNTYYTNSTSSYRSLFTDGDYSVGFWFKVPNIPTDGSFYRMFEVSQTGGIAGFSVDIMGSANSNGGFTGPKLRVVTGPTLLTSTYSNTPIQANTWYYFALTKTGTTTSTYTAYLNGTQFATWQESGTAGTATRVTFGRNGTNTQSGTFRLANYYSATTAVIGASQIAEIWATGNFGYRKGLANLGANPTLHYNFNDSSGIDVIPNIVSPGSNDLNFSSTPTWTAYPNGKSRGSILLNPFSGYDTTAVTTFGQSNTIAFWFKRSSAPASNTVWTAMYWNSETNLINCYINTNGTISFQATLGSLQPALTSTTNICDNQWHHVVITRGNGGVEAKMYIDGSLQSSQTWTSFGIPSTSFQPFTGLNNQFDEYTYFPSTTLTAQQVSDLYQSTISSTNISYPATPMETLTPHAEFIMATVTAESAVSVTYNSEAFGGNFNTADFMNPMLSVDVNLDAFGYAEANAEAVLPITTTESNLEYSASFMEASALATLPIISTETSADVQAMPMLASALLSSNVYFGDTAQDTSYNLNLRSITYTTNNNAHNGFTIGTQNNGATVVDKTSLLLQSGNGVPPLGTVIKAKFDPTKVTVSPFGNLSEPNRFNVYVFTAAPSGGATWNNITYSNLPAKELIFTTKVADDGLNPNYYLDITPAAQDSRAYTYGIFIEHVQDNFTGSNYYDRVEYVGTGLDTTLMYILTTDHLSKNVNADIMTATAEDVMPTVYVERYLDVNAVPAEVSANMVHPDLEVEGSNQYISGTLTASAEAMQPAFVADTQYTSAHLEADARFGLADPTVYVEGIITFAATALTASALFHDPQYNIGDGHEADHMNASALFVNPLVVINESVPAMVATVSVDMPDAVGSGQLLGIVNASPMTASAGLPVPPAYIVLTEDPWFNRLYALDTATPNVADVGVLKFFIEDSNITTASVLSENGFNEGVTRTLRALTYLNASAIPAPLGITGEFDPYTRKAVNLRNIGLSWYDITQASAADAATTDRGFTVEALVKTTKSNQVLFYGSKSSLNTSGWTHSFIGLNNGKIYIKTPANTAYTISSTSVVNAEPIVQSTRTNVADGQWHHIIVQNGYDGRIQIWVDGELDIQRYGYTMPRPSQIGYNSDSATLASDFSVSAFSSNAGQFLLERDVTLNYFAAIKYQPILAEPMTASTLMTQDHKARGNRGRALMLYFWSTYALGNNGYFVGQGGLPGQSLQRNTSFDQGINGFFDYDTGPDLSTWELGSGGAQQWNGWDIFPIDIQGIYTSSVVKPASYKNLRTVNFTSTTGGNVNWKQADGFYDELTDNRRYIDLIKDIDNLEDFDMIFFRNYPDQGTELDSFSKFESVDTYFNLQEKELFEDFINSLKEAMDSGISLLVTNPQLAIDLGIIDRVEVVPDLNTQVNSISDTYAENKVAETTGSNYVTNTDPTYGDTLYYFADTYKNNRHRLIRQVDGLTTFPSYIWKETIYYNNDGAINFGGNDRWWNKYDFKANGPQPGDEFIIATNNTKINTVSYQAVPFDNIKAGKPLTAFANTYERNGIITNNPYADYATSIIVEPGDILNGKQVRGKIFVSFTETIQGNDYYDKPREYAGIDLNTNNRINTAYSQGAITLQKRNQLLADATTNLDLQLQNGDITQEEYNGLIYWDDNGNNIISSIVYGNTQEIVEGGNPQTGTQASTNLNRFTLKAGEDTKYMFSVSEPWFTVQWGYRTQRANVWVPSINSRGFSWLSDRTFLEGKNQEHTAFRANAELLNPTISADRDNNANVQPMLANGRMPSGEYTGNESVLALPMEAIATFGIFVRNIVAATMTATASTGQNISTFTSSEDEIIVYLHHVDPILYLREEIIK
jgi:hypothetical protein